MLQELIKLADDLDEKGFEKEANIVDSILKKIADDMRRPLDMTLWEPDSEFRMLRQKLIDSLDVQLEALRAGGLDTEQLKKKLSQEPVVLQYKVTA